MERQWKLHIYIYIYTGTHTRIYIYIYVYECPLNLEVGGHVVFQGLPHCLHSTGALKIVLVVADDHPLDEPHKKGVGAEVMALGSRV